MSEKRIALGAKVQDTLSDFRGIVTARTEYLYGCVQVLVKSDGMKDGIPIQGEWFDEPQLEVCAPECRKATAAVTGGPAREMSDGPQRPD